MKKLIILILSIGVLSCTTKSQDFVKVSGKITNAKNLKLTILGTHNYKKEIILNKDGSFKDTLHVKKGFYAINDGNNQTYLYLKKGVDLKITLDANKFMETIAFKGKGAGTNNYMAKKILFEKNENLDNLKKFFLLNKEDFNTKIKKLKDNYTKFLSEAKNLDSSFIKNEKKSNNHIIAFLNKNYASQHLKYTQLSKGKMSPTFNYENFKGGKTSLTSLKGKYVFLDIWATWCSPCKKQIPFLKKIEEEYKGKNITFVSISIDKQKNKDEWKKMIVNRHLGGIQLISDNDWNSAFIKNYQIMGIPRFILIDPKGNIVEADAPRPSQSELKTLFTSLGI